jgi:hypothetical protein
MADLPEGPTLNPEYNALLVKWAEGGYSSKPECEACGKDLTGKEVHDTGLMWVCPVCFPTAPRPQHLTDREDFHADG